MTPSPCSACLRWSALIGFLAPRLAAVLGDTDQRLGGALSLAEEDLITAVAGRQADRARRFASGFEASGARRALAGKALEAVCRHSKHYPGTLLALADPPPVLYLTGALGRLEELTSGPVATLVGTRTPSRYSLAVAHELGRGLAVAGVTVVSGLALGVDAAAHRGALAGGGKPLAVLAGGADVPYPRANRHLYEEVRSSGLVVSELPPGQRPLRWSFPARNRIMAGLARLTIVIEAAESSGTLITAEFAAQLGREVGAVPGQVTSWLAAGSNRLLREGAAVIRSPQDALDELFGVGAGARFAMSGRSGDDGDGEGRPPAPLLAFPAPAPGGQRSPHVVPGAAEGGEPGTAITSRPSSSAWSAVISAPLRARASTTSVAPASAATMRLRAEKRQRAGGVPGGYSDTTAPAAATRSWSRAFARG